MIFKALSSAEFSEFLFGVGDKVEACLRNADDSFGADPHVEGAGLRFVYTVHRPEAQHVRFYFEVHGLALAWLQQYPLETLEFDEWSGVTAYLVADVQHDWAVAAKLLVLVGY